MRKERAPKSPLPRGYLLPDEAHASLVRTRDHLHLLSRLTAARIAYDAAELELSQDALVHSFCRLANDLDQVIRVVRTRHA
jgi:hypothetical protein